MARLSNEISVSSVEGQCVFTLPMRTMDDRWADVFVEQKIGDSFLVHDAGITSAQLYAQGVHITENRASLLHDMATRIGVAFEKGMFQIVCKRDSLDDAILAVGQCAVMGTFDVLTHKPVVEEEPVPSRVERTLKLWRPDYVQQISKHVPVKGLKTQHSFDFVAFPNSERRDTVAIKILRPSVSSLGQAERYGFMVLDTERTMFENWKRCAILTKAEQWGDNSTKLVRSLSQHVLAVKTGQEHLIDEVLPQIMSEMMDAA